MMPIWVWWAGIAGGLICLVGLRCLLPRWRLIVILVSVVLYPYVLERTQRGEGDFPVYYRAAHGEYVWSQEDGYYVYSERAAWAFGPLGALPYWAALGAFCAATASAFVGLIRQLLGAYSRLPALVFIVTIGCGIVYPMLYRIQNITGLLALACVTPLGAILAMCVKPYLFPFVVLHAARACYAASSAASAGISELEDKLSVLGIAADCDRRHGG